MKKLLMLGSSMYSVELVIMAKERGYYTIVTDYNEPEKSKAKLVSDEYWMISTADIDVLEKKCREENINAVIAGISAFSIGTSIELCKRLELPCYVTEEGWKFTVDKRAFKDVCKECGVPVSKDYYVNEDTVVEELQKIDYPVVVKAIDSDCNRGMSYCNNASEILEAIKYAHAFSESRSVIVEHMLKGHEYTAGYAIADGEASLVYFCLMTNEPGYPGNCYSLTTTCTDNFDNYIRTFDPYFKRALNKMGCKKGYAWVELMEDQDGSLNALEMGYRLGGDMFEKQMAISGWFDPPNWLLELSTGVKHTREDLPISLTALPERMLSSYILWSDHEGVVSAIEGLEEISNIFNISIHQEAFIGSKVRKHQYMFVITFDTANVDEICSVIKNINENVKISDENGENLIIYYDDFKTLYEMDKKR